MKVTEIIDKLFLYNICTRDELRFLLDNITDSEKLYLASKADETRKRYYGNKVYMRGLIEFTNYCKMNCRYCGIRRDNRKADRYRLSEDEIIYCAEEGNRLGFKTFVLQGGEDPYFTDEVLIRIIKRIKEKFPDNAVTLSVGERSCDSYKRLFEAGADRYLLRHETATRELYEKLHPGASYENRIQCLHNLKDIGYQIGAGFMVGLPGADNGNYVDDLMFLKNLEPHMCGIGPFIPHRDTPMGECEGGTVDKTVILLSIIRLLLPKVLLPATTALGTIDPMGREKGIKAGANVIMPNLSPLGVRKKYSLYNGKVCTGEEAAECRHCIENRVKSIGYEIESSRGDYIDFKNSFRGVII